MQLHYQSLSNQSCQKCETKTNKNTLLFVFLWLVFIVVVSCVFKRTSFTKSQHKSHNNNNIIDCQHFHDIGDASLCIMTFDLQSIPCAHLAARSPEALACVFVWNEKVAIPSTWHCLNKKIFLISNKVCCFIRVQWLIRGVTQFRRFQAPSARSMNTSQMIKIWGR